MASASLLAASFVALSRDNLKARLAYSTVSQLAYVVLGAALATPTSIIGSGLQIATHAAGKITLFFCAGAIYTAAHKTEREPSSTASAGACPGRSPRSAWHRCR